MEYWRLPLLLFFATSVIGFAVFSLVDTDWLSADGTSFALNVETEARKCFSNGKRILHGTAVVDVFSNQLGSIIDDRQIQYTKSCIARRFLECYKGRLSFPAMKVNSSSTDRCKDFTR